MTTAAPARVHYFDKQFLRLDEFRDEQLYQLALRRRHNVAQHTWGIVSGLELTLENGAPLVRPGMAIDGYGRELLLDGKRGIAVELFDDLGTEKLDIWATYSRDDNSPAPAGYGACGGQSGAEAYRSEEAPQILIERPRSNVVDARKPPEVPPEALAASVPITSDDPLDVWRVYLGRITRLAPDSYVIDATQRPYVGLVGETIDHPANATRVEVGKQSSVPATRTVEGSTYSYSAGEDPQHKESRRFAVFVQDQQDVPDADGVVELTPRFEIMQDGTIRMRGQTIINGNLRLTGGAAQFVDVVDPNADPPEAPSIYRMKDANGNDQLRIDLGSKNVLNRQFVIGFSADGKFSPCVTLSLQDDAPNPPTALLEIKGDLRVAGRLKGNHVPAPLSDEVKQALLSSFQTGVAAGNSTS